MRRVRFYEYGGPQVLRIEEAPRPEPGDGELLIEVEAAGVTLPVVRLTHGSPAGHPVPLPHAPGGEVTGRVAAIGAGVSGWRVGQRAAGLAFTGAYAEFAVLQAAMAAPVPRDVADPGALLLVRSGQVALGALRAASLRPGESVLVTAAAGGVGHLAIQLARRLGARRVVAAVGTMAKRDFVCGLGADQVVGYDEIAAGCGEPVDVILDGVGGDILAGCLQALAPLGRLVAYNGVGGLVDTNELRMRSTAVIGFTMAQLAAQRDRYQRHQRELWDWYAGGSLQPVVDRALPLDGAAEAHRIIEARENRGKIILKPVPAPNMAPDGDTRPGHPR
jgi:NADPH:quinone reductase